METKGNFMFNVSEALLHDFRECGIKEAKLDRIGFEIEYDALGFALNFSDVKDLWTVENYGNGYHIVINKGVITMYTYIMDEDALDKFFKKVGYDNGKNQKSALGD